MTHEVTNQGHDRDLLSRMGKQAKDVLELEEMHILADKGYFSAHEILACHEAGITATVPRSDTTGSRAKGHFVKADFAYEPDADVYRCPAGQALTHRTTTEQQGLLMRRYWTNACKGCDLKDRSAHRDTSAGSHGGSMSILSMRQMPGGAALAHR